MQRLSKAHYGYNFVYHLLTNHLDENEWNNSRHTQNKDQYSQDGQRYVPASEALYVTIDIPDLPVVFVAVKICQLRGHLATHISSVSIASWKSGTVEDGHGGVNHVSVHADYYPP